MTGVSTHILLPILRGAELARPSDVSLLKGKRGKLWMSGEDKVVDQDHQDRLLDKALSHSIDASDPPAIVQPGDDGEPRECSGFDPEKEAELIEVRANGDGRPPLTQFDDVAVLNGEMGQSTPGEPPLDASPHGS